MPSSLKKWSRLVSFQGPARLILMRMRHYYTFVKVSNRSLELAPTFTHPLLHDTHSHLYVRCKAECLKGKRRRVHWRKGCTLLLNLSKNRIYNKSCYVSLTCMSIYMLSLRYNVCYLCAFIFSFKVF